MSTHREKAKAATAVAVAMEKLDAAKGRCVKADAAYRAAGVAAADAKDNFAKVAGYPWPEPEQDGEAKADG